MNSTQLQASVIVPVRNGAAVLERCLSALFQQTLSRELYEVIVVDDGSSDATASVAARMGARVISQPPGGPSVARNRGAQVACAPVILFTDADCKPAPDWIQVMLNALKNSGVTGVKGTYRTRQTSLVARFVQREYESKYERMQRFREIDFIDTYSAGFQRQAFLDAGGYDPAFETASVEDQEFSFRLHERGAKLLFVPDAVVEHLHVDTLWGYLRKKYKIGFYKALLLKQHPGKIRGDTHTPKSLQLQIVTLYAGLFFLLSSIVFAPAFYAAVPALGAFLLSQFPFLAGLIRRKNWVVLGMAPGMIALRALGLGAGLITGGIHFCLLGRGNPPSSGIVGKHAE